MAVILHIETQDNLFGGTLDPGVNDTCIGLTRPLVKLM